MESKWNQKKKKVLNSPENKTPPRPPSKPKYAYLKDIGWCYRLENGDFQLLFNDGFQLYIESKNRSLQVIDAEGKQFS